MELVFKEAASAAEPAEQLVAVVFSKYLSYCHIQEVFFPKWLHLPSYCPYSL